MCVILVCPPKVRPSPEVLFACDAANPHGAGMAWRSKGRVHWLKNASVSDLLRELPKIRGEVVIHFRWASVGGVDARLCHPFPVTPMANVSLSGNAEAVLFQNGTWHGYRDALTRLEDVREKPLPTEPMSDTRAAALVVHTTGHDVLAKLPGRWVWMSSAETKLYGAWEDWNGMRLSNTGFTWRLKRPFSRPQRPQSADSKRATLQPSLFSE